MAMIAIDHADQCRPMDHIICRVCGEDFCLSLCSEARAEMYRLTPVHPACRKSEALRVAA